jgi:hypothetical protein
MSEAGPVRRLFIRIERANCAVSNQKPLPDGPATLCRMVNGPTWSGVKELPGVLPLTVVPKVIGNPVISVTESPVDETPSPDPLSVAPAAFFRSGRMENPHPPAVQR